MKATGQGAGIDDSFQLDRFVEAQADIYEIALSEIGRGAKRSHWMWFIFPQIAGLGSSQKSQRYAISTISEARAFLEHPLLGPRYRESVAALQDVIGTTAETVFGAIDAAKLRSSLTLFWNASEAPLFKAAIDRWFGGELDSATLAILSSQSVARPPVA